MPNKLFILKINILIGTHNWKLTYVMENLKIFFESSTIHGVSYLASTRKLQRLFWIFVVVTGFCGAGYLIKTSFKAWQDNPVTTTIETRPITEVQFPLITVCPPRGTYTNLNYDLEETKMINLDIQKYDFDLIDNFIAHFQELDFQKYLEEYRNGFQEENRYRNWYTGVRYRK